VNQVIELRKNVWRISLPAIAESLFVVLTMIVDTKMVADLGVEAISAVAVTNQPSFFIFSIFFALNITVSALIARLYGQRNQKKACEIFVTSVVVVLLLSLLFSIPCVLFAGGIMDICSGQDDIRHLSIIYFQIIMGFMFVSMLSMLINSALRGCGYTKAALFSNVISFIVNIVGNWLLILGHCGFPALGVKGAAIATVLSSFAACGISLLVLMKKSLFVNIWACFSLKAKASMKSFREMFSMWRDVTVENFMTRIGILLASIICARIGSYDMAVYGVGVILMNFSFAFGNGFLSASVALVGRAVGEGIKERILLYCKFIQRSGFICALVLGLIYVVGGRIFFGFFNSGEEFILKGITACVFVAVAGPFLVSQLIYNGILKAMGKTKVTLVAAVVSVTFVNPILSVLLAFVLGMGINGIWISMLVSQIVRFAMLHYSCGKTLNQLT